MTSYNKHILCLSLYLVLFFNAEQAKCDPHSFSTSLRAATQPAAHSALGAAMFDSDLFEPISPIQSKGNVPAGSPVEHSPTSSPKSSYHFGQASSPHIPSVPSTSRPISAMTKGRMLRQSLFTRSPSSSPDASASVPSGLGELSSASSPISVTPMEAPQEQYPIFNSPAPSPKPSNRFEQAFSSLGSSTMSLLEKLKRQFTSAESSIESLKSSNNLGSVAPGSAPAPEMSLTRTMRHKFAGAHSPASSSKSSIHLHRISRLLHGSGLSTSTQNQETGAELLDAPAPSVSPLMSFARNLSKRRPAARSPASSPKSPVYPHLVSRILRSSASSTSHSKIAHPPASSPKSSVYLHKGSSVHHKSAPSTSHSTVSHSSASSPKSSVHLHKVPKVHPHKVSRAHPHSVPSTPHSTVTHPAASSPKSSVHPHKVPKFHQHKFPHVHQHKVPRVRLHKVSRILSTIAPSASQSTFAYPPTSSSPSFGHFNQPSSSRGSLPPLSSPDASLVTDPAIKQICGNTAYPDVCLSAVSLYIKTSHVQSNEIRNDPISVLEMVITAAVQHTHLAVKFATRKAADAQDPTTASTFGELKENYSDALFNYNGAVNAANNKDLSSLKMMLSAALDDFSQYEDNHGRRSPLADRDTKLAQMTTIALNIASTLNTKQ